MKIIIKSAKLDLTPAISEYIEEKIGSLKRFLGKFEKEGEVRAEVEIARTTRHHRQGDVFYAEANIYLPKKKIRAEHSDWDIRVAIDNINKKLGQEIKKYKGISGAKIRVKKKNKS
ncbi:MAG: ribosome-associated translation inhibitor RaiA [Patescibacteria group bacterium]